VVTVDLLVVRAAGKEWYGDLFDKVVWNPTFDKAGLVQRHRIDGMHALRHWYASTLLAGGVSVKELAEYRGHADAKMTLEIYTHLVPSSHGRAQEAIGGFFQSPPRAPENP